MVISLAASASFLIEAIVAASEPGARTRHNRNTKNRQHCLIRGLAAEWQAVGGHFTAAMSRRVRKSSPQRATCGCRPGTIGNRVPERV